MSLSIIFSAALFSLLLTISAGPAEAPLETEAIVFLPQYSAIEPEADLPEPQPDNLEETVADSAQEPAPRSSPATVAPAPDVPVVPTQLIPLSPLILPEIETTGPSIFDSDRSNSEGDRLIGPEGPAGTGGQGIAGSGTGGAGVGEGMRTDLTAHWAPGMDFKKLDEFYPKEAAGTSIKGLAILKCKVLTRDRVRDCSLFLEKPQGYGFGAAALKAQKIFRVRVHDQTGRRVYNEWILVNIAAKPANKYCQTSGNRIRRCDN